MVNSVRRVCAVTTAVWSAASLVVPFTAITLLSEALFAQPAKPEPSSPAEQAPNAPASGSPSAGGAPAPGYVRLVYALGKGTAGCDSEVMFRRLVSSETGQPDPFVLKGAATHDLEIGIRRDPPGFRTIIELRKADGTVLDHHEYAERTCADAVDRAVISVMLAVFPAPAPKQEEAPKGPGAPAAAKECDECAKRDAATQRELRDLEGRVLELTRRVDALEKTSRENRRRKGDMDLSFALSTGALITANLTSNVGPGVWVGADARIKVISVGIEARAVLPSPVFLGPYDFDYSQIVGLVTPCGRYSYFFGCVVAGAGAQILRDSNYPSPSPDTQASPLLQLGGRVGVEVPFGDTPLGARAWGEVLYMNPPTTFTYDERGYKWRREDVAAFFGLGLVVFLGSREAT